MILVDTSVWVDHLRDGNSRLADLLNNDQVLTHPFIIGELCLGTLSSRTQILELLSKLPRVPVAEHEEVMAAVAKHKLNRTGIGWVDAHLLASTLLGNAKLMTNDKPLQRASQITGVGAS